MANQNVTMSKLKRAFQLLAAGMPQRAICAQLHMGRSVLNKYKTAADASGMCYADLGRLSNEDIEKFMGHRTKRIWVDKWECG